MDGIRGFFDSFKEFIWDIIGYLLPGSYVLILLSICVNQEYFVTSSLDTTRYDLYPFIFIVVSYLLGHVVYGFGLFKEHLLRGSSYVKKIEAKVATRKAFCLTKELLSTALLRKDIAEDLSNTSVRDLRNIVMSYFPEFDQKIYTFTFRSDLSNQTGNVSILVGGLGLMSYVLKFWQINIFMTDKTHFIIYLCLIISYFFLRQTRNRFYAISIGLPFSIYIANATKS